MQRQMMHGKIHGVTVTEASVDYPGSITIDKTLLQAAQILPYEKVLIANMTNGARIESYAIEGKANTGVIGLNGGAAKHGKVGDKLIIMCFGVMGEEEARDLHPRVVRVNASNEILQESTANA